MRWETPDGKHHVYVVELDGAALYRVISWPGGYWRGDCRTQAELVALLARFGIDLSDLTAAEDP